MVVELKVHTQEEEVQSGLAEHTYTEAVLVGGRSVHSGVEAGWSEE